MEITTTIYDVKTGLTNVETKVLTEKEICQKNLEQKEAEIDKELSILRKWFDTTYRYKYEKFTRLIALNKLDDDDLDPNEKLLSLYEEAENIRVRIQLLEEELNNVNGLQRQSIQFNDTSQI